jgi:hypothetical protein
VDLHKRCNHHQTREAALEKEPHKPVRVADRVPRRRDGDSGL